MTRAELRQTWAERVVHFEANGQSAAAWCAAHHVQPIKMYYWRRKLRTSEQTQTPQPFSVAPMAPL